MLINGVNCHFDSKLCPKGYTAITLFGNIFFRRSYDVMKDYWNFNQIVNHERIHVMQAEEIGWTRFYLKYLGEYIRNRFKGMTHNQAYHSISFEDEAYKNEENLNYSKD